MASLITEVVTARGAIPGVPAAKGHATVHRIAKAQMALVGVSGDILRVHGDLVAIGREPSGLDLHEYPALAAGAPANPANWRRMSIHGAHPHVLVFTVFCSPTTFPFFLSSSFSSSPHF